AVVVPGTPVVDAGGNQTITLPTSSTSLTATASETNGTIVSYAWTQLSGPSTAVFGAAGSATTGVSGLVQGVYSFQITVKDNSGVTASDFVKVTVNPAPIVPGLPVVDAGADQTITLPTNSVTLVTTASETNGTIVSTYWTQVSGPSTANFADPSQWVTTAGDLVAGVYVFEITVTDNSGVKAKDQVQVTVKPAPIVPGLPVANAGGDVSITLPTNSVKLAGSGSETNGTIVGYTWTQVNGPSTASIVSPNVSTTVISNLVAGVYTFQLTVKDNSGVTATDQVQVTVNPAAAPPANQPPVANAGPDQTVNTTETVVNLDGSASYDPDGTIVKYQWIQTAGLGGVTITNAGAVNPAVYGMKNGTYTFELTVTDNKGATATDQVSVTMSDVVKLTANAGTDTTVAFPATLVTLDGSQSTASGSTITGYSWKQLSGPSDAQIIDASAAQTTASQLIGGVYVFQLTVTDDKGNSDVSTVRVRVMSITRHDNETMHIYPNPFLGTTVTLNGTNPYTGKVSVKIYDLRGSLVVNYEFNKTTDEFTQQVPVPGDLGRGVYALRIYFEGQSGKPRAYFIIKQ
ncbi:MAG: T9SS type A sorting domain-containing protein, partial [Bacteroidetes bacterium]|nr:T9SS type A sorting domain-containing protein [Bacteroidota bacterium]